MDIIFGSISAEQRQDDIDKRQKGTSLSNSCDFILIIFGYWCIRMIVELNRVPSNHSIRKVWSSSLYI